MKKQVKERETMDIVIYGNVYTLIKRADPRRVFPEPCFMGNVGWALQSICKRKKNCNKPSLIRTR